jgi:hypothetical protein
MAVFADAARAGRSLCFTFTPEATVRPGFPERVRGLVGAGGGRVRFVGLRVSEREQERRIGRPERSEFHKLTSLETLRRLRNYRAGVEQPPTDLEIDTDGRGPADSAAAIADHFGLTAQDPAERYPATGDFEGDHRRHHDEA